MFTLKMNPNKITFGAQSRNPTPQSALVLKNMKRRQHGLRCSRLDRKHEERPGFLSDYAKMLTAFYVLGIDKCEWL